MRQRRRATIILATAATTAIAVVGVSASARGASRAHPLTASTASQKVIVVLRDQLAGTPAKSGSFGARKTRALSSQSAVLSGLSGPAATHVKHFSLGNAFSATVTAGQAAALAHDPRVASVVPDRVMRIAPPKVSTAPHAEGAVNPNAAANGQICPTNPAEPIVEPEALESINAYTTDGTPAADDLADGSGVTVAFIADSMDPNYADFIRPGGQHVFVDYQDFSGEGPSAISDGREAFGDASSIAAQGVVVHDLSNFVNQAHPLPPGCNIVVRGVAPGASLVGLVFGSNSSILQAIDYAVTVDHVNVLNESFGLNSFPDYTMRNGLTLFNDAAVDAGVTVTVSSGDAGITNTIGSPPDPKVIQVAATTDNRLYAQTSYAAFPFSNGKWISDNISALSSSGITQYARTVDLAAPGEGNWADCSPAYTGCRNFRSPTEPTDLQSFGGTSESAPLTAGVAALVIQAYRSTHSGADPTPAVIKQIITGTAHDLGLPADEQGAGLLDARAATEAALTYPGGSGAPAGLSSNLITSTDQLTLSGPANSTQTKKFSVVNVGTDPLTVAAGSRTFQTTGVSGQATAFDASTLPTFVYYNGQTWAYKKLTFSVGSGTQRLLARLAFHQNGTSDTLRMTLLAPDGTFVANSRPQGAVPNYANVDVRNPAAGTWTAVLYSIAGGGGYSGVAGLEIERQRAIPTGSVSPATFTLAPGASQLVRTRFQMPAASGDSDAAITLASSDGHQVAVSAVFETLIDTAHGGAFSGDITGGNARAVSPAQTFSYAFKVPAGKPSLNVAMQLDDDSETVDAVLLDPKGELADVNSNLYLDSPSTVAQGSTIQLFDNAPLQGTWHLVVVVQNPVAGDAFSRAFTGAVTFTRAHTARRGLPNSSGTVLPAGHQYHAHIRVTNNGVEPIAVGLDARLNSQNTIQAVPIQGSTTLPLPADPAQAPIYVVPPDTSGLTVAASSTLPAQVEMQGSAAGFDVFGDLQSAQDGSTVSVASLQESAPDVSKGIWFTSIDELGPYGDDGPAPGSTTITGSLFTANFDRTVTSSTGDPFLPAVDATANGGTPALLQPGETVSIQVTIVPQGSAGHVVSGHINVVTPWAVPTGFGGLPFYTTGESIAALPYSYTIG